MGKKLWKALERLLKFIQAIILKGRKYRKTFLVLVLLVIVGFNIYSEESVSPIYEKQLLIGHRGGEYGVENTLATLLFAGLNGADYVEMDVLLTKDNIPVN